MTTRFMVETKEILMKLRQPSRTAFMRTASSHLTARILLVALAASIAIVIAPRLRSVTDAVTPTFVQTNLVSDRPGLAKTTDSNLVNPWGMALGINSGVWIADNGSGRATTYDGMGPTNPVGFASGRHNPRCRRHGVAHWRGYQCHDRLHHL